MAKQTFTTGQVLTAAQVNSLQTNDFNQTVSVKTAAYVLAAADKGTRIEFNTSGSVSCTVNTGLFDAGDTVIIQNRGAGDVTVTAGTATVNTAGSLVLSQYQSGTLYFISASASIFFAAAVGDLTAVTSGTGISISNAGGPVPTITNSMATEISAKGDLIVGTGSGSFDNLAVGTNGHTLVADSATSTGLKWAAPAASDSMTLINTGGTTLTGASVSITSIPGTYNYLFGVVRGYRPATDGANLSFRFNNDTNANRHQYNDNWSTGYNARAFDSTVVYLSPGADSGTDSSLIIFYVWDYANTTTWKFYTSLCAEPDQNTDTSADYFTAQGIYNQTGAITRLDFFPSSGNFTSGTLYLYGVK